VCRFIVLVLDSTPKNSACPITRPADLAGTKDGFECPKESGTGAGEAQC
jgi:hypothetical protein